MATEGAAKGVTYKYFEPFSEWEDLKDRHILKVHLPGFTKEELRVFLHNDKTLKVSGERFIDALTKSKFHLEKKMPRKCNSEKIRAAFGNEYLRIVVPKFVAYQRNKPQAISVLLLAAAIVALAVYMYKSRVVHYFSLPK